MKPRAWAGVAAVRLGDVALASPPSDASAPALAPVAVVATPVADSAIGLRTVPSLDRQTTVDQRESARVIERTMRGMGLPDPIIRAAIANALAESNLDPTAKGDYRDGVPQSIGLFQLYSRGAGAGMTIAERMDPTTNTKAIVRAARNVRGGTPPKGARAGRETIDPLTAYARGERDAAELSAAWMIHVESPRYSASEEERRRGLAARLWPDHARKTSVPGNWGWGMGAAVLLGASALALVALSRR